MPCTALSPIAATRRAPSRDGLVSLAAVTAIASLAMLAIGTSRAQPSPIRITREAPVVTYIEVDPRNPPPDAPAFDGHESGLCRATFEIRTSISYTASAAPRRTMRVTPTSLEAVTRLKLEVFTLKGVSAKVHAHEEAHRQINEHFYREAADVARELAQATVGKPVAGTGATRGAAEKAAFDEIVSRYNAAYFARTRALSTAANDRFDDITDHGRNPITEADAFVLAIGAAR